MAEPRTRPVDIPGTDGPSIRPAQAVPLEAPRVIAPPARTGLDGLSQAFNSFFGGAAQGLLAVAEGTRAAEKQELHTDFLLKRAEAEKENKQKGLQGKADALSGAPMRSTDYSYATAYQKAAGEQHGAEMQAQWFQEVYSKAKPGDDLMGLTNDWLKNNWGKGTGSPDYDAAALSHFKGGVDRAVLHFAENSVKSTIATGLQAQDANVAAAVKDGSIAGKMGQLAEQYRALDPTNPEKAPLRLAQAIQNSIYSGDPRVAQGVLAALEKPGTGVNGKSYAESFPAAYKDIQGQLTSHYLKGGSIQGASEYARLQDEAIGAKADPVKLAEVGKKLELTFQKYGGASHYLSMKEHIATQLAQAAKVGVAVNQIREMVSGSRAIDPKPIDAHLPDFFAAEGIDPRQQPEAAGAVVAKLGVAPSALKADMSQLMVGNSVEGQQTAIRYFNAINASYNDPNAAKRFMNDDAATIYDAVSAQLPGDLPTILNSINENKEKLREAHKIEWNTITGTKTGHADVQAAIKKSVAGTSLLGFTIHQGAFSGSPDVNIDWATQSLLESRIKTAAILSSAHGLTDIQKIADQQLQNAHSAGQLELVPGEGGHNMVRIKRFGDFDAATGKPLVHLGVNVMNPNTRKPEDTLSTYRSDMDAIANAVPGLIPDTDNISVAPLAPRGVGGKEPSGSEGVYFLQRSGARMTIGLGQEIDVKGKKETVPAEPREALAFLQKTLPADRGIVLVPNAPLHMAPTAFYVGYRPRFTGKAASTPTDAEMRSKRERHQRETDAILQLEQDAKGRFP